MLKGKSVHSAIDWLSIPLAFMFRDYLVTMDAAEQKGMKEGAQKAQLQKIGRAHV